MTIRLGQSEAALLEAEAEARGVALGALIREAAVRAARDVGREIGAGRISARAANGSRSVRVVGPGVEVSAAAVRREEPVRVVDPGVARAAAFLAVTQRR